MVIEDIGSIDVSSLEYRPRHTFHARKVLWMLILISSSLVSLVLFDVSIARIRYHYNLTTILSPVKRDILEDIYEYHGLIPEELKGCRAFNRATSSYVEDCALSACEQNAMLLSNRRQGILHSIRDSHPSARLAAELFDGARGMEQSVKIETLFKRKSCEGVIASSDKTNIYVDCLAFATLISAIYMMWRIARSALAAMGSRVKID
jgi:hypothetical protein